MNDLPIPDDDQVVRIFRVHVLNGKWTTIHHDKLCKYKHLSEEKQKFIEEYHAKTVNFSFVHITQDSDDILQEQLRT